MPGATVRVRAINAAEISSGWGYSEEKTLTGKVGNPPKPVGFIASDNVVFGIELSWGFPANTDDTLKTEIQYSLTGTEDDAMLLADVPYPQRKYQQMGLKAGQIFWYRAQLVDRSGNESGYTDFVRGQASIDVSDITDAILEDMKGSDTFKDLIENAVDSNEKLLAWQTTSNRPTTNWSNRRRKLPKMPRYREGSDQRYKPVEHGRRCVFFSERT